MSQNSLKSLNTGVSSRNNFPDSSMGGGMGPQQSFNTPLTKNTSLSQTPINSGFPMSNFSLPQEKTLTVGGLNPAGIARRSF